MRRRLPDDTVSRLLLAWGVLAAALYINDGTGPVGLPLVLGCVGLVFAVARTPGPAGLPSTRLLAALIVASGIAGAVRAPGGAMSSLAPVLPFRLLALASMGFGLAGIHRPRHANRVASALVAIFFVAGALLLADSPAPRIDVFTLQQEGARELLAGRNPYGATYTNPYTPAETREYFGAASGSLTHYPYPPLTLLPTTVSKVLTGDVRYAMLAAQAGAGLLLYALARASSPALAVAILGLHLGHPRGLFVLEMAWTESLVGFATALLLFALARRRPVAPGAIATGAGAVGVSDLALGAAVGMCLGAKQYSVLMVPFLLFLPSLSWRSWAWAIALCAALTLPFAAWGPRAFIGDLVLFQAQQPFRMDALSLPPVVAWLIGVRLPGVVALVAAAISTIWVLPRLRSDAARRALYGGERSRHAVHLVAVGTSFAYLAFFITAKQAFCNYYYYVGVLLLAAAATAPTGVSLEDAPR